MDQTIGGVVFDNELLKWLASMGVGGVVAGLIFLVYRKDVKNYTELWKEATLMLASLIKESTAAHIENTQSNREMIGLLRALHQRLDNGGAALLTDPPSRRR